MKNWKPVPLLLASLAALVVGLPLGYAVAAIGGGQPDKEGSPSVEEIQRMMESGPVTDIVHNGPEADYYSEGVPTPEVVQSCKDEPVESGASDPLLCDMILAVASGALEPGEYTAAEIRQLSASDGREMPK